MNSHFLCQFENSCFENNALKMASRGDAAGGHEEFQVPT